MSHVLVRRAARSAALALVPVALAPVVAVSTAAPAEAAVPFGDRAVNEASKHKGKPYKWGATGPSRFDCSGLTSYVFRTLGKRIPRTSNEQYRASRKVPNMQKKKGDLIFTYRNGRIGHVGIYAGGSYMWAATKTGDTVRKQSFHGRTYRVGRY